MQEGDGHGGEAAGLGLGQGLAQGRLVQRPDHLASGAEPFVGLDHAGVQGCALDDVQGEKRRAGLVADGQSVGESAGCDQQGACALTLEQGVGGHRGSHLDGRHALGREGRARGYAQQAAHALHGGVSIGVGRR